MVTLLVFGAVAVNQAEANGVDVRKALLAEWNTLCALTGQNPQAIAIKVDGEVYRALQRKSGILSDQSPKDIGDEILNNLDSFEAIKSGDLYEVRVHFYKEYLGNLFAKGQKIPLFKPYQIHIDQEVRFMLKTDANYPTHLELSSLDWKGHRASVLVNLPVLPDAAFLEQLTFDTDTGKFAVVANFIYRMLKVAANGSIQPEPHVGFDLWGTVKKNLQALKF